MSQLAKDKMNWIGALSAVVYTYLVLFTIPNVFEVAKVETRFFFFCYFAIDISLRVAICYSIQIRFVSEFAKQPIPNCRIGMYT